METEERPVEWWLQTYGHTRECLGQGVLRPDLADCGCPCHRAVTPEVDDDGADPA